MRISLHALGALLALLALGVGCGNSAGQWSATGSMKQARFEHTAVLLPNGKVLVAGGRTSFGFGSVLASAELYDPATGTWSSTGSMSVPRASHTATLLKSGKVLVTGGHDQSQVLDSTEIYDPGSGTWTPSGRMTSPRMLHTATEVLSGKVVAINGQWTLDPNKPDNQKINTIESWDPGTGTWSLAGKLVDIRARHTASLLSNGKVLVCNGVGGFHSGAYVSSTELYDPVTMVSVKVPPPPGDLPARNGHTATTLKDGRVLLAGGRRNPSELYDTGNVYDPVAGTWADGGKMASAHYLHVAALLPSGEVLVCSGDGQYGGPQSDVLVNTAERYLPKSNSWVSAGMMAQARIAHTATTLHSGKVLVTGGCDIHGTPFATSELYAQPSCACGSTPGSAMITGALMALGLRLARRGSGARRPRKSPRAVDVAERPTRGAWSTPAPR